MWAATSASPTAMTTAALPTGAWRLARTPVLISAALLPQTEIQHFLVKCAAAQNAAAELIQCVPYSGKILPLILFCL